MDAEVVKRLRELEAKARREKGTLTVDRECPVTFALVVELRNHAHDLLCAAEEAEGMRKALEKIAKQGYWSTNSGRAFLCTILDEHTDLARAALTPKPAADGSERQ